MGPTSGDTEGKFGEVTTSTNAAYELVQRAKENEHEYDVIGQRTIPPLGPRPVSQNREEGYANLPQKYRQSPANPSVLLPNKDGSRAPNDPSGSCHPSVAAPWKGRVKGRDCVRV